MVSFHGYIRSMHIFLAAVAIASCGGGGGGSDSPPAAPQVSVTYGAKSITLNWGSVSNAGYYQVSKQPVDGSGYSQIGSDQTGTSYTDSPALHLVEWMNLSYIVSACNEAGCTDSTAVTSLDLLQAIGYFKASNTDATNQGAGRFGASVALSSDGMTMAVGAIWEDSVSTGIDNDQSGLWTGAEAGAVYVFTKSANVWSQQAYVKASNTNTDDQFGFSVALSTDGNTLAVGAYREDSASTGINNDDSNDSAVEAGAVYVFTRSGDVWSQQAYIKASNTDAGDNFGEQLALSAYGNTLAVGASSEASTATGINVDETNNDDASKGAVYVFTRSGNTWSQQTYIKSSYTGDHRFGRSIAISDDGLTLAVSSHDGVIGDGVVSVFSYNAGWSEQDRLHSSSPSSDIGTNSCHIGLGSPLALSASGNTLAAGDCSERSNAIGIDGDASDTSALNAGAVYVFSRTGSSWSKQAYVKASNTDADDNFGASVALSDDGDTLAVGAFYENGSDTGVNGDDSDNTNDSGTGAVYVYTRDAGTWSQQAYVKPSNTHADPGHTSYIDAFYFGLSVSLSADGETLAVGANTEPSIATGVNGDQTDTSAGGAGAVYLY